MIWQALTVLLGGGLLVLAQRILWVRRFFQRLDELKASVYHEVNRTYVDEVKAASADGKLTDEEARRALRLATDRLKELIGVTAVEGALRLLGLPWMLPAYVDEFLAGAVEAEVGRQKQILLLAERVVPLPLPIKEENR